MVNKIAITLRKGGRGKTTTAANLAAALHLLVRRVLLVDLDPQANATLAVGIDPMALVKSVNDLFTTIDTAPEAVVVTTDFGLPVLPSHPDLARTEGGMRATQVGLLRGLLAPFEDAYEFAVIDTPPAESYLAVNVLVSVGGVL